MSYAIPAIWEPCSSGSGQGWRSPIGSLRVLIALLMFGVYRYRIHSEEAMLLATFGDRYRQYCQQTWKLLPFLY